LNGIIAGQALTSVAKWTGGFAAEYITPISNSWRGFFGGDLQVKSHSFAIDRFRQSAYELIGLHVGAQSGSMRISLYVKNLADQYRYIGVNSLLTATAPYEAVITQPRTIGVSISRNF
jgi:outer membrane receptor protein involved in Fe transport